MNSEQISTIALNPFISKFVFTIIKDIKSHNFSHEKRHVIHADLVPKVSKKVMQASLKEKIIPSREIVSPEKIVLAPKTPPILEGAPSGEKKLIIPIKKPVIAKAPLRAFIPVHAPTPPVPQQIPPQHLPQQIPPRQVPPQQISPPIAPPSAPKGTGLSQDYGKITPLLNDPSVSLIECPQGTGKPLMIVRAGQRQITRIILSPEEIKEILQKVSDAAYIPLLEGVFRAAVDNFSINAVISDMIGSRFVIKK